MPFKSLDLFSGIGGITFALREYFEPTMYCDVDRSCQDVIARHIDDGSLPRGTLMSDVRSIHSVDPEVRAIVGGSPCQSISCMGKREGIADGTKSGLFLEIVRIIDENPNIDIVFLENVANILRVGAREVLESLTARGFTLAWTIKHARGFGAPHKRERWFCLALRGAALNEGEFASFVKKDADFPEWSKATEPPRVAVKPQFGHDPKYHANWPARQKLLGNSVVPIVVRSAFEDLASRVCKWEALRETLGEFGTHFSEWKLPLFPVYALVGPDGVVIQLPNSAQDNAHKYVPSTTLDVEGTLLRLKSWPTPRAGNTRATRLNGRAVGDLGSVLVHCLESQIYVASAGLRIAGDADQRMADVCVPNTHCVEWAMGYPPGWTSSEYPEGLERTVWPVDGVPETTAESAAGHADALDGDGDGDRDDADADIDAGAEDDDCSSHTDDGSNPVSAPSSSARTLLSNGEVRGVVRMDGPNNTLDLDDGGQIAGLVAQIEADRSIAVT